MVDPLDILEIVDVEKPLRALDFCYQMDPDTLSMLDAISLCITVVAYAPDSQRGHQMLVSLLLSMSAVSNDNVDFVVIIMYYFFEWLNLENKTVRHLAG